MFWIGSFFVEERDGKAIGGDMCVHFEMNWKSKKRGYESPFFHARLSYLVQGAGGYYPPFSLDASTFIGCLASCTYVHALADAGTKGVQLTEKLLRREKIHATCQVKSIRAYFNHFRDLQTTPKPMISSKHHHTLPVDGRTYASTPASSQTVCVQGIFATRMPTKAFYLLDAFPLSLLVRLGSSRIVVSWTCGLLNDDKRFPPRS